MQAKKLELQFRKSWNLFANVEYRQEMTFGCSVEEDNSEIIQRIIFGQFQGKDLIKIPQYALCDFFPS